MSSIERSLRDLTRSMERLAQLDLLYRVEIAELERSIAQQAAHQPQRLTFAKLGHRLWEIYSRLKTGTPPRELTTHREGYDRPAE